MGGGEQSPPEIDPWCTGGGGQEKTEAAGEHCQHHSAPNGLGIPEAPDTRDTILTVLMTAGTFGRQGMCGGGWRTVKGRVNSPISPGQRKPCNVRALRYSSNTISYSYICSILFYSTLLYSFLL